MSVSVSDVYYWSRPELLQRYKEWELSTKGTVQELRERLTAYVRAGVVGKMEDKAVGVTGGNVEVGTVPSVPSQILRDNPEGVAVTDLLKHVPQLVSEEPKEVLRFFVEVKTVYDLKLVSDKIF
jgi:hypothetical protein